MTGGPFGRQPAVRAFGDAEAALEVAAVAEPQRAAAASSAVEEGAGAGADVRGDLEEHDQTQPHVLRSVTELRLVSAACVVVSAQHYLGTVRSNHPQQMQTGERPRGCGAAKTASRDQPARWTPASGGAQSVRL